MYDQDIVFYPQRGNAWMANSRLKDSVTLSANQRRRLVITPADAVACRVGKTLPVIRRVDDRSRSLVNRADCNTCSTRAATSRPSSTAPTTSRATSKCSITCWHLPRQHSHALLRSRHLFNEPITQDTSRDLPHHELQIPFLRSGDTKIQLQIHHFGRRICRTIVRII